MTPSNPLSLDRDLETIRGLYPVTQNSTYLLNAAQSPLNLRSRAALDQYLDWASTETDARPEVREPLRRLLSGLLGGRPNDYAITTSTGTGISTVAAGMSWQAGDNVVLPAGEHWNSTFPWFNLSTQGVETRTVPPAADNRVSPEAMAAQVDDRTRVISVTAVRFDTGFRADLREFAKLAQAHDALLVVDGTQCAGANVMNVIDDGIDVLCCGGFKWLMGLAGTGFMYVNQRAQDRIAPVSPGMFAAKHSFTELDFHQDARRYETGTIAYTLMHGWAAGLALLAEIGIDNIATRNRALTDRIITGLKDTKQRILTPVAHPQERSAIVAFTAGDDGANKAIFDTLQKANVQLSLRHGSLRVSPNFFNTETEIDRFLNAL
ncbi:aminotransferase class V-fold PLP-dependent enzyme [Sulfitobacter sp. F26204]|uniref:aminotransferase class V-fold PLP-dependent enzyme n=1 Tax=Sulfitobacter sp. F26204 TaxID=2996014 RepID=UPI00225E5347|nr:aminotransferase class V-fold PLP-dependent enzyme [Sulfitobacter sp. F26204]MCX7560703.1 aminotransferase class V-fold PLP-dependent enzyme [Sulfitobacter sp. F26204]